MKEYPVLSDYIAYTTVGHEIDPMSYVKGMEMNVQHIRMRMTERLLQVQEKRSV